MSLEKKVRKTIKKELQTVNSSNAPRVFEAIQTDLGYKNIEIFSSTSSQYSP